jgi:hypothetical protein
MDGARHVIGCQSTQQTRVHHAFDELASTIHTDGMVLATSWDASPLNKRGFTVRLMTW